MTASLQVATVTLAGREVQMREKYPVIPKHDFLYRAGDLPRYQNCCYRVTKGAVELQINAPDGRVTSPSIVVEGTLFGHEVLLQSPRLHDAFALLETQLEVVELTPETERLLVCDYAVRTYLLEQLFCAKEAFDQIALVRKFYGKYLPDKLMKNSTFLARLTGMSREMVSRVKSSGGFQE